MVPMGECSVSVRTSSGASAKSPVKPTPQKPRAPGTSPRGSRAALLRYFFSIFLRSISFLSASRFSTLNSTRRFFDMLSTDVFGTSGRTEP